MTINEFKQNARQIANSYGLNNIQVMASEQNYSSHMGLSTYYLIEIWKQENVPHISSGLHETPQTALQSFTDKLNAHFNPNN